LVCCVAFISVSVFGQMGGVRGTVTDKDFEALLPEVKVRVSETEAEVTTDESGSYYVENLQPGSYTLIFLKGGYSRFIRSVVVTPGQLTDLDVELEGEYEEMDELVVRDIQLGGSSEIGLLNLRMDNVALMDSIGADLMSKAGAGDAASALRLVAGASIQDGKYAVVRGLPDRYVSSQINGVRLPSADADKRAVQLDQFPSALIENIQVLKTFTPDQQGDASGGAVNVVLKKVPEEPILSFKIGTEFNTQTTQNDNFLTYKNGGVDYWGRMSSTRALPLGVEQAFSGIETIIRSSQPPPTAEQLARYAERDRQISLFQPVMGTETTTAPLNHSWSVTAGNSHPIGDLKVGALGSFNYKADSAHYEDGINDKRIGLPDSRQYGYNGTDTGNRYELYDVTKSETSVLWGGMLALGAKVEDHEVGLTYMQTKSAKDSAMVMNDTRGTFEPTDPSEEYYRNETLRYIERETSTIQLQGDHTLPFPAVKGGSLFELLSPKIDWTLAQSDAALNEPDLRGLVSLWRPDDPANRQGTGTWAQIPTTGSFVGRRIWRDICEESMQYQLNGTLPFEQWTGTEGFLKAGYFHDDVKRSYNQDSFTYLYGPGPAAPYRNLNGTFMDAAFSDVFSNPDALGYKGIDFSPGHQNEMPWQIIKSGEDADYEGDQKISAWYWMVDLPLTSWLKTTGGIRTEDTYMATRFAASDGQELYFFRWETGALKSGRVGPDRWSEANAEIKQTDILPALSVDFEPIKNLKFRGAYSRTIARPTFKEISPILQLDYLGSDQFIGNNNLQLSELENYDLRAEYLTSKGTFLSASWFYKEISDPIEYVSVFIAQTSYVQPFNFPEGWLSGYEFEARQEMGYLTPWLEGVGLRVNATLIDSEVTVPEELPDTGRGYAGRSIGGTQGQTISHKRPMRGAPDYLLNANVSYDLEKFGTQFNLFYVMRGDVLFSGEGYVDSYVPDVYEKAYGELNFGISQKVGEHWSVSFMAKNLTDPAIQKVYRSNHIDGEAVKSSYTKGVSYSVGITGSW
jgi:TonB-dependent receptor